MTPCKFMNSCPFFKKTITSGSTLEKMYKEQYCHEEYTMCARYKIAEMLGHEKVPSNLYPNMFDQAEALIRPRNG